MGSVQLLQQFADPLWRHTAFPGCFRDGTPLQTQGSQFILGTRTYEVTMVRVIADTDWSYLQGTADNRITLTTCLENQPTKRICVQAVAKGY